jgi:hypothetical protein
MSYEIIKLNYEKGLWSIQMLEIALKKGVITQEEFNEIVK